jgi:hypothetical protein
MCSRLSWPKRAARMAKARSRPTISSASMTSSPRGLGTCPWVSRTGRPPARFGCARVPRSPASQTQRRGPSDSAARLPLIYRSFWPLPLVLPVFWAPGPGAAPLAHGMTNAHDPRRWGPQARCAWRDTCPAARAAPPRPSPTADQSARQGVVLDSGACARPTLGATTAGPRSLRALSTLCQLGRTSRRLLAASCIGCACARA